MEQYAISLPLDDWRTILFLAECRAEEEVDIPIQEEYYEPIHKVRQQLGWEPR